MARIGINCTFIRDENKFQQNPLYIKFNIIELLSTPTEWRKMPTMWLFFNGYSQCEVLQKAVTVGYQDAIFLFWCEGYQCMKLCKSTQDSQSWIHTATENKYTTRGNIRQWQLVVPPRGRIDILPWRKPEKQRLAGLHCELFAFVAAGPLLYILYTRWLWQIK